jgi:hypothetical protein
VASISGQLYLRTSRSGSHQRVNDWKPEVPCELTRLVEATVVFAPPVKRNWNDKIGLPQNVETCMDHQSGKQWSYGSTSTIFERVHNLA